MAKSTGNGIKPLDMADKYGTDPFRYYVMRDMVVGQDANFSEEHVVKRLNSDLANDLGNLLNRITKLLTQHFDGIIPEVVWDEEDPLIELSRATTHKVKQLIEDIQIHTAIEETLQFVRAINRDITEAAPWTTVKTDKEQAGRDLARAAESLRIAAILLNPIMPKMIPEVLTRLGLDGFHSRTWDDVDWSDILAGKKAVHGDPLFPRHRKPGDQEEKNKPKSEPKKKNKAEKAKPEADDSQISFEQFKQVDLRTAVVLEAEPIEDTDKLMKLKIDLGSEQRQLVAGIKQHYTVEEIIGKTIIVVANLQPAKIRGVKSQGMLLAVHDGDELRLLTPSAPVSPGKRVS
ncbi:methionine--tRNA ligase [bacterium BMS3Bbin04]|nr:methionine--tRNA ligase [bacterium BMS3Bbin04]